MDCFGVLGMLKSKFNGRLHGIFRPDFAENRLCECFGDGKMKSGREPPAKTAYRDIRINFTGLFVLLCMVNAVVYVYKKRREERLH